MFIHPRIYWIFGPCYLFQGYSSGLRKIRSNATLAGTYEFKQLRGSGLTGYYRCFINIIPKLFHLTKLLKKDVVCWTDDPHLAFKNLKAAMTQPPVLALLDFTSCF